MVTFNHARFIEQAIEGVMMQKTDFPFKLFIGEDCSNDGTREICVALKEKYPDKIELILRDENMGAVANALEVFEKCFAYGKYTAICEGDDYWTDPYKLQKQVSFLEANPDFVMSHHNLEIISEDKPVQAEGRKFYWMNLVPKEVSSFEDLAQLHHIATPSSVFRNNLFGDFPGWYKDVLCADYILHLLIAQYGKIKYIDEVMGVYRTHSGGIWSGKKAQEQMRNSVEVIRRSRDYFYPKAAKQFIAYEIRMATDLGFLKFNQMEYKDFRKYYRDLIATYKQNINLRLYIALTLRYFLSFVPFGGGFYNQVRVLKNLVKGV